MNKVLIAAVVGAAVVLAFIFLRPSPPMETASPRAVDSDSTDPDATPPGGGFGARGAGEGGLQAARPGARAASNGGAGAAAVSGTTGERRKDLAAVRDRLAAASARAARGAQGGPSAGVEVDDATLDGSDAKALRSKSLSGAAGRQGAGQGSETTTTMGDPVGEPVPEVAYDSGLDKNFVTESQTELPDVGKISGESGTVSFWVKPDWDSNSQDDAGFVQLGDSGLHFVKNVNFLRFEYFDKNGAEQGLGTNISDWKQGEWRQVIGTWNGTTYQLYVDGKQLSQSTYPLPPDFQDETKVYVGSNLPPGAPPAPGEMSGVKVLNRWTSAAEIARQFQTGQRPGR
jgi:hypothetical protein